MNGSDDGEKMDVLLVILVMFDLVTTRLATNQTSSVGEVSPKLERKVFSPSPTLWGRTKLQIRQRYSAFTVTPDTRRDQRRNHTGH